MGSLSLNSGNTFDIVTPDKLPTPFQEYIHQSRYARWREDLGRRETWGETVDRYLGFMSEHLGRKFGYRMPFTLYHELRSAIIDLKVMPSMRALMTAGPALERENMAGYNCSYLPFLDLRSFSEALFILMCGTGQGFSVESRYVKQIPSTPVVTTKSDRYEIVVQDSKEGWALAFRDYLEHLWEGRIVPVNTSLVRPKGTPLKTFGGLASGPEPFLELIDFVTKSVVDAKGAKLRPIQVHDIGCKIGEIVVVGGVRRSAEISLSDLHDIDMRDAKSGEWMNENPQRMLANNSAVYETKPGREVFDAEWNALVSSGFGERGIFNREACVHKVQQNGRRKTSDWVRDPGDMTNAYLDPIEFGTNPCSEIILRPFGLCNLTEVIARDDDGEADLREKVRLATILGTFQSTLTDFNEEILRPEWRQNAEEERLLGVSMTGIMDCAFLNFQAQSTANRLRRLRTYSVLMNGEWASMLGINRSAAITCVKPSGTVSQLCLTSSGIHPAYGHRYIRRVRGERNHPVTRFMVDKGIPHQDDMFNKNNVVFEFAHRAPDSAVTRHEMTAIEQLDMWLMYYRHWCEHKPSCTVYVRPEEWAEVGEYVYSHFDEMSGVSFLPFDNGRYLQAPYEEVDQARWDAVQAAMPADIDWRELGRYESQDNTTGSQELACSGGVCEIVDVK